MTSITTLSGRLRMAREMGGLSAIGLSRLAGLPAGGHVALIESASRPNPTTSTLSKICAVLGVSMDWLVSGEGKPPKPRDVRAAVARARSPQAA